MYPAVISFFGLGAAGSRLFTLLLGWLILVLVLHLQSFKDELGAKRMVKEVKTGSDSGHQSANKVPC